MSKQLRLDVAQLTDVGRKREHNEDNMAYVIPKDQQVVAKKGALFIVADGMGGHAAGEVASEIAVDTVSNAYYQDDNNNVAGSLLQAIRRANAAIHQRAAENMLRSGMGTTCVATVVRGNRAYIANVGDSRAYLVRGGQVKQISQDHSWVAEQVRAGLLTEDQARTHAQRNVITRCLGTQAEVEIDVFSEQVEEGDFLVLCTDGLSGLVSDEEITRIVNSFVPQESVYHLVERANENGGPDNITAIVVRINEVGEPVEEPPLEEQTLPGLFGSRRTVRLGGREGWSGQEMDSDRIAAAGGMSTVPTGVLPTSPGGVAVSSRNGNSSLRISSGSLVSPEGITAPQPAVGAAVMPSISSTRPRKRSRLFYPTLTLLVLFVVVIASGAAYYFIRTNEGETVNQTLQQARGLIQRSRAESSANPTLALSDLARAQNMLRNLQHNTQLSNTQSGVVNNLLSKELAPAASTAIAAYNTSNKISVLPCDNTSTKAINTGSTNTSPLNLASVMEAKAPPHTSTTSSLLYAQGQDSRLYRITNQYGLVDSSIAQNGSQVASIAGTGSQLFVLLKQANSPGYALALFSADASGKLSGSTPVPIDSKFTNGGEILMMTAWGSNVYVIPSSNTSQSTTQQILNFRVDSKGQLSKAPTTVTQISVSANIEGVAAFPQQLFLLLQDGEVMELHQFGGPQTPESVTVQQSILTPLAGNDVTLGGKEDVSKITLPMVTPVTQNNISSLIPLKVAGATSLAAGSINDTPHLYIGDQTNHRMLDLSMGAASTSGSGTSNGSNSPNTTLSLVQQYASFSILNSVKSIAVDPKGTNVYALVQSTQNTAPSTVVSMTTGTQTGCGS